MTAERPDPDLPSLRSLVFSDGVPRSALLAALVVGSVLNLINQGDVLWGEAALNWPKMLLTYCVPYCVATFGAVSAKRRYLRLSAESGSAGE